MSLTMAFSADIQGESRDIGVDNFKLVLEKPGITSFYFYDLLLCSFDSQPAGATGASQAEMPAQLSRSQPRLR